MISNKLLIHTARIPATKAEFDGLGDSVTEETARWKQTFKCRLSHLSTMEQYAAQGSSTLVQYRLRANGKVSDYPFLKENGSIVVDGQRFKVKSVRQTYSLKEEFVVADLSTFSGK